MLPSIIGGVFDLATQGISAAVNAAQANSQRKWQEKMYARQVGDTRLMRDESWKRQDALLADERRYNSPENQIALAREAGLNPALINGGQMTSPLTSISGTGASPEAPSPGSYTYTPIQPSQIGSRAVGNYLQAQAVDVSETNAETARMNAETERFSAQARAIRDIADAGRLDNEAAGLMIDNIFKAQTFDTKVNIVKQELNRLSLDNQLKDFDLTHIRPAFLDNIRMSTKQIENEISLIPARLESLQSSAALNRQSVIESESRVYLQDYERLKIENEITYLQSLEAIADTKLTQEQFVAEHQMAQFIWGNTNASVQAVSNLFGALTDVLSKGKTNAGKNKGKNADVSKPASPVSPVPDSDAKLQKQLDNTRKFYNESWKGLSQEKKNILMNDPKFMKDVYPYIKNK